MYSVVTYVTAEHTIQESKMLYNRANLFGNMKLPDAAEKLSLLLVFALLLFIGYGSITEHSLSHQFPYGYLASDAFQHQVRAEAIKDAGNFRYEAPYISLGFEKAIGRYPPIIYHLSVIFSYSAGLEVYDSIYFIVFFFSIIGVLVMYYIIRNFNKNVAVISLPLAMLIFSYPLAIGFAWGHWPSLLGQFFLIAFAWCIVMIDLEKSYIPMAITFASIALTHTSEAVFAVIFLILFFAARLISRNLQKADVKNVMLALIVSFLVSLYYLTVFMNSWAKAQPYSFAVEPVWQGNPGFYILDFGVLLIFIAAGILFSLFRLKDMHTSFVFGFAMLLGGFLNYIGFGLRSFQLRFFWPIYLSAFFGFGAYMLLKLVIKKWSMVYSAVIFIALAFLLISIKLPGAPQYSKFTSPGIMDPYHWAALEWLSKNTEANSKIYFFYGDIYNQDALLRNSKRLHYQVDPDDFIKSIQNKKIKRFYLSELPGDGGGSIVVKTGYFTFEDITKSKPQEYFFGQQDICRFDYLIFDKISRQQVLAEYNLVIASELLKKGYMSKVFENNVILILKNSKAGADCIEERSF